MYQSQLQHSKRGGTFDPLFLDPYLFLDPGSILIFRSGSLFYN